ncbi:MAG: site-2 protease family protein [Bacillota bacterium]|nr:site-2 protease family protein [Bacillota bacterium]
MFGNIDIAYKLFSIPAILLGFTFHEFAHALVADRLGDRTPRFQGRLTLNPVVHIDIVGFILIMLTGFGWAKPVQINPNAYKHYYKDDLKVSIAGPIANILLAFVFAIITSIYTHFIYRYIPLYLSNPLKVILLSIILTNCSLFVLNLIPIPGFDGFHILRDLSPAVFIKIEDALYQYQMIIWIALVFLLSNFISVPSYALYNLFIKITMLQ